MEKAGGQDITMAGSAKAKITASIMIRVTTNEHKDVRDASDAGE